MKFGFFTLGCKVNLFETQALSQLAQARGHEIVTRDADVYIINTCTVTSVSDHKNLRAFHKIRRENPGAIVAACGCFAQACPEKVLASGEIDLVCGTTDRAAVITRCEQAAMGKKPAIQTVDATSTFEILPAGVPAGRTRALLKVQDGCDNYCTYCIIPYARGHVRSIPLEEAVRQACALQAQGVREIVLTGIEISAYGQDLEGCDLIDLLEQICNAVPDVRIRLSSLEPRTVGGAFCCRLSKFSNLMPHFHLSLQSGCDSVLARMKRHYTTQEYLHYVQQLRTYFPQCSITTDLIVGFPQETEAEFQQTLSFLQECAFAGIHVFPYSPRKGTIAAGMSGQLPPGVKAARAKQAKALARQLANQFLDSFLGCELMVLLEHPVAEDLWSGHAQYHFPVFVEHTPVGKNHYVKVRVNARKPDGLHARVCP